MIHKGDCMTFGEILRTLMEEHDLTQKEVATRLNRDEDEIFAVLKMPNVSKPMPWQVPTSFPLPQP